MRVRSGPTREPSPRTAWQSRHSPLPSNSARPRRASPSAAVSRPSLIERRYSTTRSACVAAHRRIRRHRRVRDAGHDRRRELVVGERAAIHAAAEVDARDQVAVGPVAVRAQTFVDAPAVLRCRTPSRAARARERECGPGDRKQAVAIRFDSRSAPEIAARYLARLSVRVAATRGGCSADPRLTAPRKRSSRRRRRRRCRGRSRPAGTGTRAA